MRLSAFAMALLALAPWTGKAQVNIEHWTTDNGIRVYFARASELPIVDMRLVFDAGAARDGEHLGVASMTAGLLNEGSGKWSADDIAVRFEDVGAQFSGDVELDQAYASLRALSDPKMFEPALETFIKVVTAPSFPQRAFERVKNQILVTLQGEAQDPDSVASKAFYRAVYGEHPFANPVYGTAQSVRNLNRDEVRAFYKRYFVTGNAVLALVGDLTRAQAEKIATRLDESMAPGKAPNPLPKVEPVRKTNTIKIPFPSEQAHVYMGEVGIPRGDLDYFRLYVGNHVLGGSGFTARLVKAVRVKRGLSYSVYSYFLPELVAGPFMVGLQTRADQASEATRVAMDTIEQFVKEGPTGRELKLAKSNITGGFPLRIASNADILEYLALIGYYRLPLDYLNTFSENVNAVKRAEILKAFRKHLNVERMVKVIVGGGEKG